MAINNIYPLETPIISNGNQFLTNWKYRMLFSSTVDVSVYYGLDTSAYITKWNSLSSRSLNDINDANTLSLAWDNKLTYLDNTGVNNNSIYNYFYKEDLESNFDDGAYLTNRRVKLTKEDINNFRFSDKIYLNTTQGSGFFRVNKINYKPDDFSIVQFIKINYMVFLKG